MPLSSLQRRILRLLAASRTLESYVAEATAINRDGPRISDDIDIFHDREEAVAGAAALDATILVDAGLNLSWMRREPALHTARLSDGAHSTRLEWVRDSDFRFFPAMPDPDFGYRLHLADIASNKALAAAGRKEPRDVVDLLTLHDRGLSLSALIWAAVAKDPGYSPQALALEIQRNCVFQQIDYDELSLASPVDAADISRRIKAAMKAAISFADSMPPGKAGLLFLDGARIVLPDPDRLDRYTPHSGQRKGHWPSSSEIGSAMVAEA